MTKMNTQNTLYAIDQDLNALYHFGVKGQKKHQHDPNRRWQRQAVYANGQPDPNAKPKEKSSSDSGKKEGALTRAKNAVIGAKARFDAKNDAAIRAMRTVGDDTKGADRFNRLTKAAGLTGAVAGGLAGGAIGGAIGSKLPATAPKIQQRLGVSNYARQQSKYGASYYAKPERLIDPIARRVNKYGASYRGRVPSAIDVAPDAVKGAVSKAVGLMPSRRWVGGYVGGRIGAVAGGTIGYSAATAALYKGYVKRGAGSLKGAKVSPAYEKAYKSKFNDYYKKYSQKGMKAEYEQILAKRAQHEPLMKWSKTSSDAKRLSVADFDGNRVPRVSGRYVYGS